MVSLVEGPGQERPGPLFRLRRVRSPRSRVAASVVWVSSSSSTTQEGTSTASSCPPCRVLCGRFLCGQTSLLWGGVDECPSQIASHVLKPFPSGDAWRPGQAPPLPALLGGCPWSLRWPPCRPAQFWVWERLLRGAVLSAASPGLRLSPFA